MMSQMAASAPPGRVDQLAILVPDLEAAMDAYIANMGVTFGVFEANETTSTFSGSSERFSIRIAVALVGFLSIELIQPFPESRCIANTSIAGAPVSTTWELMSTIWKQQRYGL